MLPEIVNLIIEFGFTHIANLDSITLSRINEIVVYPLDLEYGRVILELQKIASKVPNNDINLLHLQSYKVPRLVAITGYSMDNYHNYQFRIWSCIKSKTIENIIINTSNYNHFLWRAIVGSLEKIPDDEYNNYKELISYLVNKYKYDIPNCTADSLFKSRIREICPFLSRIHSIPSILQVMPDESYK